MEVDGPGGKGVRQNLEISDTVMFYRKKDFKNSITPGRALRAQLLVDESITH